MAAISITMQIGSRIANSKLLLFCELEPWSTERLDTVGLAEGAPVGLWVIVGAKE
jgi:hypothetical protein